MNPLFFDHAGFIVRDLSSCHALLAELGFSLTTRADHTMTNAQGQTVSAGSSQHTIVFEQGYLELMEITNPAAGHQLAAAPTVRYGLHILALGAVDAKATHQNYLEQGQDVGVLRSWSREVREADRQGLARFAFFDAKWTAHDPSYICWVQHLTPSLIRSSRDMFHANSALSVLSIRYAGPVVGNQQWVDRLQGYGIRPLSTNQSTSVLDLGATTIEVGYQQDRAHVAPVGIEIGFRSLHSLRQRCISAGIEYQELPKDSVKVDLRAELGLYLIGRALNHNDGLAS